MRCVSVFLVLLFGAVSCFASLIPTATPPTNAIPNSGSGYGNVLTLLNAQDKNDADGLEANCNIINSSGQVVSQCSGPFSGLALNNPGNENQAQTIAATGITDSTMAASQLLLVFNINQTGVDSAIALQALGLALWYNGSAIFSALTTGMYDVYDPIEQGIGTSGFGYKLDASQAATAQTAINNAISGGATLSTILVTGAFKAGCPPGTACANDGAETLFLSAQTGLPPDIVVPEPASILLLGTMLTGVAALLRRKKLS